MTFFYEKVHFAIEKNKNVCYTVYTVQNHCNFDARICRKDFK